MSWDHDPPDANMNRRYDNLPLLTGELRLPVVVGAPGSLASGSGPGLAISSVMWMVSNPSVPGLEAARDSRYRLSKHGMLRIAGKMTRGMPAVFHLANSGLG